MLSARHSIARIAKPRLAVLIHTRFRQNQLKKLTSGMIWGLGLESGGQQWSGMFLLLLPKIKSDWWHEEGSVKNWRPLNVQLDKVSYEYHRSYLLENSQSCAPPIFPFTSIQFLNLLLRAVNIQIILVTNKCSGNITTQCDKSPYRIYQHALEIFILLFIRIWTWSTKPKYSIRPMPLRGWC